MKRALIVLLIIAASTSAAAYGFFLYKTRDINRNQAQVEALAAELLPGARPVAGSIGVAALSQDGMRVAVLAPSLRKAQPANLSGQELRFVIVGLGKPMGKDSLEQIQASVDKLRAQQEAQGISRISSEPTELKVAGRPHPGLRAVSEVGAGGPKLVELTSVFQPAGNAVVLVMTGPEASFNKDGVQQFLDGLVLPKHPARGELPRPDGERIREAKDRIKTEVRQEVRQEVKAAVESQVRDAAKAKAEERLQEKRQERAERPHPGGRRRDRAERR